MYRIGVVGLGLRNPYTYASLLNKMNARIDFVWDYSAENAQEFADQFGCRRIVDLSAFPYDEVDGILVESKNHDHCRHAGPFIDRGIPVFIEKPLSNDCREALAFLKLHAGKPVFSCSPLRFSETYASMRAAIEEQSSGRSSCCRVIVLHTMEHFLTDPLRAWHDRQAEGGGMLVDIGIHAVELLNMFMRGDPVLITRHSARSYYGQAESYDLNHVALSYQDHSIGQFTLLCATNELDYAVDVYNRDYTYRNNRDHPFIPSAGTPEDAYGGFRGTMAAFLDMVRTGKVPLSPQETIRNFGLLQRILVA